MRVVLVRHETDPLDDRVTAWFRACGIEPEVRRPFRGETLDPADGSVAASVIYGGPFNVFEEDRHPFLLAENRWIESCLAADIPLLGICQGAQSIARVLGAKVGPPDPEMHEFGYYPVHATEAGADLFPDGLHVTQAHFHGFDIPAGAERLARSDLFPNQAMRYGGNCYGFQFHAEMTPTGFRRWQDADWAAYGKPGAQTRARQDALQAQHDGPMGAWFNGFMDGLFGGAVSGLQPIAAGNPA